VWLPAAWAGGCTEHWQTQQHVIESMCEGKQTHE
jgi:hypothetical protein